VISKAKHKTLIKATSKNVIPAKAGIQKRVIILDSRLRGSDKFGIIRGSLKKLSEENLEDKLLEYNPDFLSSLEKAKEEYLKLGGISVDSYLRRRRA